MYDESNRKLMHLLCMSVYVHICLYFIGRCLSQTRPQWRLVGTWMMQFYRASMTFRGFWFMIVLCNQLVRPVWKVSLK